MAHPSTYPGTTVGTMDDTRSRPLSLVTLTLWVQGLYYLITGVWPLVSIETFLMATGPKTDHLITGDEADHWLVKTVGVLITAVAVPLLIAAWRRSCPVEVAILAILCAIGLTAIDVIYVARQTIPPIYLVDAAVEMPLITIWAFFLAREKPSRYAEELT
jgi:hypothetical protein